MDVQRSGFYLFVQNFLKLQYDSWAMHHISAIRLCFLAPAKHRFVSHLLVCFFFVLVVDVSFTIILRGSCKVNGLSGCLLYTRILTFVIFEE